MAKDIKFDKYKSDFPGERLTLESEVRRLGRRMDDMKMHVTANESVVGYVTLANGEKAQVTIKLNRDRRTWS